MHLCRLDGSGPAGGVLGSRPGLAAHTRVAAWDCARSGVRQSRGRRRAGPAFYSCPRPVGCSVALPLAGRPAS